MSILHRCRSKNQRCIFLLLLQHVRPQYQLSGYNPCYYETIQAIGYKWHKPLPIYTVIKVADQSPTKPHPDPPNRWLVADWAFASMSQGVHWLLIVRRSQTSTNHIMTGAYLEKVCMCTMISWLEGSSNLNTRLSELKMPITSPLLK